jgi:hypothetical protein
VNDMHPLGRLIQGAQDALGWSNRRLEREAAGKPGLGKSNIGKIKTQPVVSLKADTIKSLSEVLRVPVYQLVGAALESMDLPALGEKDPSLEDAVRTNYELTEHDRRILLAVLREMRTERGGNADSTAPITHAGESPATDQERHERSTDSLHLVDATTSPRDEESARRGADEDELARWRREREGVSSVTSDGGVDGQSPGQEEIPLPDETLMAGYDEPQESILAREQQDVDAEGPQD